MSNALDLGAFEYNGNLSVADYAFQQSIAIYPNPSTTNFTIDLGYDSLEQVVLYNDLGQKLKVVYSKEVDVSNLNSGVYYLTITSESGKKATKKVVKY